MRQHDGDPITPAYFTLPREIQVLQFFEVAGTGIGARVAVLGLTSPHQGHVLEHVCQRGLVIKRSQAQIGV